MPIWFIIIVGEIALGAIVAMFFQNRNQQKIINIIVVIVVITFIILMLMSTEYDFVFKRI